MNKEKTQAKRKIKSPKEWTIMVYMAGDNNLSEEMITGLKGMLTNAGRANINLVAVYDSCRPSVPVQIYDFSKKLSGHQTLSRYSVDPKIVAAIPYTTKEFVGIKHFTKWVLRQTKYKAHRYGLIVSGHSDGILGRALVRDDEPTGNLDLKKLLRILNDARSYIKRSRKKFDLLGFDSCLMSMLEVAYEFRDIADVMVGSEGNIPSSGWNYREIVETIPKNGKLEAGQLAENIVNTYSGYNRDYAIGGRALDISACDLTKIQPFVDSVNRLAEILLEILEIDTGDPTTKKSQSQMANFVVKQLYVDAILLAHYESQLYLHDQAVDILDFVENLLRQSAKRYFESILIHNPANTNAASLPNVIAGTFARFFERLYAERDTLRTTAYPDPQGNRQFIIGSEAVGPEYQYSKGISIFLPWTELALDLAYRRYKSLVFNGRPRVWLRFIERLSNLTLRVGPPVSLFGGNKASSAGFNLNLITFADYKTFGHRQHTGRQHSGRQHSGRGDFEAFYRYFSELRNYSTEL